MLHEEEPVTKSSLERNIEFSQDVLNHRKLFQNSNKKLQKKYKFFYDPYVQDKNEDAGKMFKVEMNNPLAYKKAKNIHLRRKYAIEILKATEERE